MNQSRAAGVLAGFLAFGSAVAQAAEVPEREFGLLFGGGWADSSLTGDKHDEGNPLFGVRYGHRLGSSTHFFSDLVYGPYDGNRAGVGDADVTTLRGGLEWLFSKQQRHNWFMSGGLGLVNVDTDHGHAFTRPLMSVGLGQSWAVGINDAFRWEVRADQSFGNDSLPRAGLTHVQALLGYSWGLGAPPDADGDGVPNRLDECPNTPRGAQVDSQGCPLDADRDGVFDGLDKCPGTPAGAKVNADGCPPRAAAPEPAPVAEPPAPRRLTLEGVNFDNNRATLRPDSAATLAAAAATLKEWGEVRIEVAGHTDSVASDVYNLKLSQRRAETVRAFLIKQGIAAERLFAKGYGEAQPVADNRTREGRFRNRRVELVQMP